MKIVVFEDKGFQNLLPLVYFRPVWDLRCGALTLLEKMKNSFRDRTFLFTARQYLNDYFPDRGALFQPSQPRDYLFLNGRWLPAPGDVEKIDALPENAAFVKNDRVVAFRAAGRDMSDYFSGGLMLEDRIRNDFDSRSSDLSLIEYPWDLIDANGAQLAADFSANCTPGKFDGKLEEGVHILNRQNVYTASGSRIYPGTVIDAEAGPVWIDENVRIMPNAVLEGPLYVGKSSVVKIGAKIYENTSIGPVCKVGGEVEETIIHGFSNKQHDGFLGHSYLAEWINIGADTNNSDLKNNYGEITVSLYGERLSTGKKFLGLIMGDHSKTAINTMFNTGTVVGVNCNIYGAGFPPTFIPSFSWGGSSGLREYNFEKAVEVAKIVMARRNIDFSQKHLHLFESIKALATEIENRARVQ